MTALVAAPLVLAFAAPASAEGVWAPRVDTTWQWQLSGELVNVGAEVYDVDGFESTSTTVDTIHSWGARAICYVDVGGWENYRPDAGDYPATVLGNSIGGWPDERWVDVRQLDVLAPIIGARFDMCAAKGFDAIEPDIMETYAERNTGFQITKAQQIAFNTMVFNLAHERGLGVAMKNGAGIAAEMAALADFAVVEECLAYSECGEYMPYIDAGKAVLQAEYSGRIAGICRKSPAAFSTLRKKYSLGAWFQSCS